MKKLILAKTFYVCTFLPALVSCKNMALMSDNMDLLNDNYSNAADERLPKNLVALYQVGTAKIDESGVAGSFVNNSDPHLKNNRSSMLKTQTWIICKPQFDRVRSEGFLRETNRVETLF